MQSVTSNRFIGAAGAALVLVLLGCGRDLRLPPGPRVPANAVGRVAWNRYLTASGQVLTPAGRQVPLPKMRPQVLALSPDGRVLATSGKARTLVLIDAVTGEIRQTVSLSITNTVAVTAKGATSEVSVVAADLSFTGLVFSPDGRRLYLSSVSGKVWSFPIDPRGVAGSPAFLAVPEAKVPQQKHELPTGLAVSADSHRLYVAGSLGNRLHELEAQTGKVLRSWDTGVAPYDVVLTGGKAYVSNLGGRRPGTGVLTGLAGKGTTVRVDPVRHIASEGSVTVIDLVAGKVLAEVLVGLHASALAVSPSGRYVVVANSGSDTLSVIDTRTDEVVEKIWARQSPADLFGAQPNALAFGSSDRELYVCNGTQNAVAVVRFDPEHNASKVTGLIPVGWFPGAIQYERGRKRLCVANIKGVGASKAFQHGEPVKLNSKDSFGTISLVPVPSEKRLAHLTEAALANMRYPKLEEARQPARAGQPARPVPERVGEPSVFKHVIYVIKENRCYDQVLGDMPEGNGNASLCVFGEDYTPNQHKLAREFVLLDNTYCAGVQSADGHQWADSAIANEYTERQITSGTPRSYTGGKSGDVDALAWASSGFIWDNVLAHGKTFRNYGEWMISEAGWKDGKRKEAPRWEDYLQDYYTGAGATRLRSRTALETLRPYSDTNTVGWDLSVPDQMRASEFIRELHRFETNGGFPNFILLFLPNDHSGGTRAGLPSPGSQIADNDLALGRVVEALSHSPFWPETCLFAIEDDPQYGWDHVSGYRTTCYVASPYTKRRQTISTPYNQVSLIRTMELILGLPPMNQMDATATPMFDCFTATPDFTPFSSVPNRFPLDHLNPVPSKIAHRGLRQDAIASSRLRLDEPDRCPEDQLNRILWRAMKGPETPYPEWAVKALGDDDDD